MFDKIILGSAQFGFNYGINNKEGKPSQDKVFEILDFCRLNNINNLDTADAYGDSSKIIGNFHKKSSYNFSINTKFKIGSELITEQLSNSLKLLSTDSINTYFFHSFEDFVNSSKILPQLLDFKNEGKINKIGVSIYDNLELNLAIESSFIDVIQIPFNLLDNLNHRQVLLLKARKYNKSIQARSVFLQGLFFKKINELPNNLKPLENVLIKLRDIALDNKIPIERLALQYVNQTNEIDKIIFGVDNLEQLKINLQYLENEISPQIISKINEIFFEQQHLLYPKNWN